MLRELKYRLRALLPPLLFLGITWYFLWNAMHGNRGLEAQRVQTVELAQAKQAFAAAEAQRNMWETKIGTLNGKTIAGDMLDTEARLVLNLANPADLIVQLGPVSTPAGTPNK